MYILCLRFRPLYNKVPCQMQNACRLWLAGAAPVGLVRVDTWRPKPGRRGSALALVVVR